MAALPESESAVKNDIDSASSDEWLASYLAKTVASVLSNKFESDDRKQTLSQQVECVNKILRYIEDEWSYNTDDDLIADSDQFLRGIYETIGYTPQQIQAKSTIHPKSGYRTSSLFTGGGKEVTVGSEISLDIKTADRIDLLVSFIKFRGWRLIADELREFVEREGTQLRVLTTTYMGATDAKAIRELYALKAKGNVEIKASFNGDNDRLHAKVYGFYRNSGQDTAYIGSSNLSKQAITTGMEWNLRVTSQENGHIIEKMKATFEQYWTSEEFEPIACEEDLKRFENAIFKIRFHRERKGSADNETAEYVNRFIRKSHQIRVLDKLRFEREVKGSYRNLIVAATGTGKTAISAFDYKDFRQQMLKEGKREPRLLFIAHRKKILTQARYTYRSVLVDGNFGQLWVGDTRPNANSNLDYLFISIQTFNRQKELFAKMPKDHYDYIVVDEAHHSMADSYRVLFELFEPRLLIGLTATPERMDGKSLLPDFNDRIAAEIRLPEALNQGLLCPFDYYCVSDISVDLSTLACQSGKYAVSELTEVYERNKKVRFGLVQQALDNYVNDPHDCRAVCFCCSIDHAASLNQQLNENGYKSLVVTSRESSLAATDDPVNEAAAKLAKGEVNYLCVADMFNEGVDIPEIDTVLFMRPTESLTIFLQQLGRGLRLADGKSSLTVIDFVAQANKSYNYETRFRALMDRTNIRTVDAVKQGFPFLPAGCSIKMEQMAQEYILKNIQEAIFDLRRLRREVANFRNTTDLPLTLRNFLELFNLDWRQIYKSPGGWTYLKQSAGLKIEGYTRTREVENMENGLVRLYHINSNEFWCFVERLIDNDFCYNPRDKKEAKFAQLFYYDVLYLELKKYNERFGTSHASMQDAIKALGQFPYFVEELKELVALRLDQLCQTTQWIDGIGEVGIELYGCYSSDEIHLLCENRLMRGNPLGTQYIPDQKLSLVFVTTNKSDKDYSPSTLYKDYAVNECQFHWQSKNDVTPEMAEGQRFIHQKENGWRFLLFVRETKKDVYGNTNAYYCLGLMDYASYEGASPMNIIWNMRDKIPGFILEKTQAV